MPRVISPDVLAPLIFLAAGLLAWGGAAKLLRPQQTSRALREARLPSAPSAVRVLGAAELAVGTGVLIAPTRASLGAVIFLYGAFSLFVMALIRRHVALASCGCFGGVETPPSMLHVTLNVCLGGAGILAFLQGTPGVLPFARDQPLSGVPVMIGLLVAGYLASMALSFVPPLFFSYRRAERS